MLSSKDLTDLKLYKKRRNVYLYKGSFEGKAVVLKCAFSKDPALHEAFRDEYKVLHSLNHPGIPAYYFIDNSFYLPELPEPALVMCMEDCSVEKGLQISRAGKYEVLAVLDGLCDLLSWLLDNGILYTDLNPSNLILLRESDSIYLSLVDYTYSYFFIENPYPSYSLRFSYDLTPALKGQQLLVQELSFLLADMLEEPGDQDTDQSTLSRIYGLIETGLKPSCHLTLSDYQDMIRKINKV